jgi:hypothetical protein
MPLTHTQLVNAVQQAMASETRMGYPHGTAQSRYDWLTEVDLAARTREALVRLLPVPDRMWIRVNAQGRKRSGTTNHDIEIGQPMHSPIEVVFYKPKGTSSCRPIKYVDDDLGRLFVGRGSMHVVAFLPKMRVGYAINNHSQKYTLSNAMFTSHPDEFVSGDCLSLAGLSPSNMQLFSGVFIQVPNPVRGSKTRYSLDPACKGGGNQVFALRGRKITRTIVGGPTQCLWAVVWSNV